MNTNEHMYAHLVYISLPFTVEFEKRLVIHSVA